MVQYIATKFKGLFIKLALKFKECRLAMDGHTGISILKGKLEPIDYLRKKIRSSL